MQTLYGWFRRHPTLVDSGWGLLLLVLAALAGRGVRPGGYHLWSVYLAFCLALAVLLSLRRRWPNAVTAAAAALGLFQLAAGFHPTSADVALLAIAYTAANVGRPWASRLALFAGLLAGPLTALRFEIGIPPQPMLERALFGLFFSTPLAACWVLGRLTRTRRAYYAQLEDRAARLERERDAQSKIAVAAERARIARELHDVVAHNVSVMIVQADGAAYVLDSSPEQARNALETIASTGRQALAEMRRLLGILRSSDAGDAYVPQPGVEQLPELIEQARTSGLPVVLSVQGEPRALPRGVELTAYRIVQEALTNVRKHGGPGASATVRLAFGTDGLDLAVEDDGRGSTAELAREGGRDGLGHGLIGMRERVGMVGGSIRAEPLPGGGFGILARLPLQPDGSHPSPSRGAAS
ncbi:sensor histidine kinase [Phaeacidiphilus oryzae]|uniref:sensor histidine kinase n=1 Tax=Phaeacidiphilus oryzae TaxID=348818 RepID=UPI00055E523C|nr:sensor histidine kinase [Phaeacidiphilus oryzae]